MEQNICRCCLLQDMDDNDYYQSVVRYRQTLPPGQKSSDEEYQRRLTLCRECKELMNGVCGQCGCYVEMRAAAKKMRCPFSHW